jgi:hypothetical protein
LERTSKITKEKRRRKREGILQRGFFGRLLPAILDKPLIDPSILFGFRPLSFSTLLFPSVLASHFFFGVFLRLRFPWLFFLASCFAAFCAFALIAQSTSISNKRKFCKTLFLV